MRFKNHHLLVFCAGAIIFTILIISHGIYSFDSSVILIDEKWQKIIQRRQREVNESVGCHDFLDKLKTKIPVSVLLIDLTILELIGKSKCDQLKLYETPIEVATSIRKDLNFIPRDLFQPFFFEVNQQKDYLELDTKPRRIIPKSFETVKFGNLAVPLKPFRFRKFWEKSRLIECSNSTVHRKETDKKRKINLELAVFELSRLQNLMIQYDMFPFISEGTLLGWYRECSIIPHTQDIDISVFASEFNPKFVDDMRSGRSIFRLSRRLGKLDALELTVAPRQGYHVNMDIFLMYQETNETTEIDFNWISGLKGDGERLRYHFPLFEPICSADLLGHLVWTTCDPEKAIIHEYGERWFEDIPTKNYSWFESVYNVQRNVEWYSNWELSKIKFEDGYPTK
ncbi:hypothetical protein L3Y34_003742 [Caenorhabditis briggsae]|uniref:W02B3.4-like N-terminal domain-containing protein n=1 Tax=Caenorhabditis briggsae TaxID=6238 RepID=A0AAE9AE02_CAEBR|nr:hypothetical protein L3Y34_003742 [Caenorhabditis briggsae]